MRALVLCCCVLFPTVMGQSVEKMRVSPFTISIRLYNPQDNLGGRIRGDVKGLSDYINSLEKELAAFWAKGDQPKAKGLLVAVGVKPHKKVRVWCEAVDGEIPADVLAKLENKLSHVPTVKVIQGPIAFAINISLAYDSPPTKFPTIPKVWTEAAKKSDKPLLVPDELFKVVWPD